MSRFRFAEGTREAIERLQPSPLQRYQAALLAGLGHHRKHVYGGTVAPEVVEARRERNRRARRARRVHRLARR